jgi:hypothetical protein
MKRITLIIVVALMLSTGVQPLFAAEPEDAPGVVNLTQAESVGETPDYATRVWGAPWDMSDPLDVRQLDSPYYVWPNHFNLLDDCEPGIWCGQVRSDVGNPDLFFLHPGYGSRVEAEGKHDVGRLGRVHPIDANLYTQLTFRMYIDSVPAGDPGLQIYWTNGSVGDIGASPDRYGGSHFYRTFSGWHIYTIDLSKEMDPLNGELPWTGKLTGLRLDPGLINMQNRTVKLDWVRLTPRHTREIEWSTSESDPLTIQLENGQVADDLLIYSGEQDPISIPASAGSYEVPVSLPAGEWTVELSVGGYSDAAVGPWVIDSTPVVKFLKPSRLTGVDYATYEMGKSWDMNSRDDVYGFDNVKDITFSDGVLAATSVDTNPNNGPHNTYWEDPNLLLLDDNYWDAPFTVDPGIDTSKYRYLSFRVKLEGVPDVSYGWVARVVWSDFLFENCGTTDDIPLHAGWNEVVLDLWDPGILEANDPCQSRWRASPQRRQLRLDPHEVPVETRFYVDYVKLTSENVMAPNETMDVRYEVSKEGAQVQFYYDTDLDANNGGRVEAKGSVPAPAAPPTGEFTVYLPAMMKGHLPSSDSVGGERFLWDLSGVAPGTYYLSATVNDGKTEVTWYNRTPVIIE